MCEERDAFHDALRPFFERPICNYMQNAVDDFVELLTVVAECEDEDDIFYWWANEDVDKLITVKTPGFGDEDVFDVSTAEGHYNYLYAMYHHREE
jgi:hypothetical protein